MHELPLVFFTVFTQSTVGAFILILTGGTLGKMERRRMAIALFSMMCLFGLGVVMGIFHVGQPLRALNMLFRIGASPMSNEIALSALFSATGGLAALGLLINRGGDRLFTLLAWVAAATGILFLFAIPQIYQLQTVVTWRSSFTVMMMLLTPLIGGGMLAALFGLPRLGITVSIAAILVGFCLRPAWISTLMTANSVVTSAQTSWFTAQAVLLVLGMVCALIYTRAKTGRVMLAAAALVVTGAELAGRIAFYNLWTLPM